MMEKLLLSLCAAAGILVAGCSDPSDGESYIRIAPSITRVDGVNFLSSTYKCNFLGADNKQ